MRVRSLRPSVGTSFLLWIGLPIIAAGEVASDRSAWCGSKWLRSWPKAEVRIWYFQRFERPLSGKADIQVVSVLSVSPQRLWAKDTEGLPKRPFNSLILKGEKRGKAAINSKVPGVQVDTLEPA